MYKQITLLFLFLFALQAYAQTGTIKGSVKDAATQEAIIGAYVMVEGTTVGASTDINGNFSFKTAPGNKTLVVTFISYKKKRLANIKVVGGQTLNLPILLEEDATKMNEVVIVGQRIKNTEAAVITEIKNADQVVSGISSEQISKSQDRDAAQVVQRIPGVSVVDNRFIMIRGLNDRYNTVWLNDVTAPSAETDKKAFSFDVVPSSLIDRVMIFKTPSPELPGDFAGGLVKVYTRNQPESKSFSVNYSTGYRMGTTLQNYVHDKGNASDWLGMGSQTRQLPSYYPTINSNTSSEQRSAMAKQLNNNFVLLRDKATPDQRFGLNYTDTWSLGMLKLANISSVNYSNTNTSFDITRKVFDFEGTQTSRQADEQYTNNVRLGVIQNFTLIFPKGDKLEFRNLFNQLARNQTTIRNTFTTEDVHTERSYAIGYQSRSIYSGQLAGTHNFNDNKTAFNWVAGYGVSAKNEPDLRRVSYGVSQDANGNPVFTVQTPAPGQVDIIKAGRLYQNLFEDVFTFNAGLKHELKIKDYTFELNTGTYIESKARNFRARAFGYSPADLGAFNSIKNLPLEEIFADERVGTANGFRLLEDINPTYKYSASNQLVATYLSANLPIGSKVKLLTGVRYEYNNQNISTRNENNSLVNKDVLTNMVLPSANLSYNFSEKALVRLAYGRTLNRPEFREWSPFYYYDFDFNTLNYGSLYGSTPPRLLETATIDNFDLRYELYPSASEMLNIAVFYKNFTNPIESVVIPTTNLAYSFANANSAYTAGIEIDVKKNLQLLDKLLNTGIMDRFSLLFNTSLIQSRVDMGGNVVQWNPKRSLQGQSPYVVNSGLYYQDSAGWSVSAMYNVFGPRIVYVGSDTYPDVIEMPRQTLDLSITKQMTKRLSLNIGVQDILNQPVTFLQDFNRDGKYERKTDSALMNYKRGSYFNGGLKYNF